MKPETAFLQRVTCILSRPLRFSKGHALAPAVSAKENALIAKFYLNYDNLSRNTQPMEMRTVCITVTVTKHIISINS